MNMEIFRLSDKQVWITATDTMNRSRNQWMYSANH